MTATTIRLTQYAHGGGCACKIPPEELESVLTGLVGTEVTHPAGDSRHKVTGEGFRTRWSR